MYVLAYVSEDNSYVIVSESDVICDMDTVKVGDEVTVISRSRDTGKHMEYSAKVIMINGKFGYDMFLVGLSYLDHTFHPFYDPRVVVLFVL